MGSILSAFNKSNINFKFDITGFALLVSALVFAIIGFIIWGALTNEAGKRSELFTVAGIGVGVFIVVLFFGTIITTVPPLRENERLNVSELMSLAKNAEDKGNYERAIMHLELVKSRLKTDDETIRQKIEEKIKENKMKLIK